MKQPRVDGTDAPYTPGGQSWTENFLIFDNSYFKVVIFTDAGFSPFAEKFRDSQDAFFESYAKAHKKLSELGSKFDPPEGIEL
jgi:L-ascorbate peroxidase